MSDKKVDSWMCKSCNYATTKKGLWARHLKTAKHARNAKGGPDTYNKKKYVCGCGNKYSSNSSLWRHGQKCSKYTKKKKYIVVSVEKSLSFDRVYGITDRNKCVFQKTKIY